MIKRLSEAKVTSRGERFAERASTRIWKERPAPDNPYLAEQCLCHGYDLMELMERRRFPDMLFLLLRGELPDRTQAGLLEALMVGLANPGPRHGATRAVMNAAVSRTQPAHLLPIGLSVMSGDHLGAGEVESAMRFLRRQRRPAVEVAAGVAPSRPPGQQGDVRIAPGFGTRFGGVDPMPGTIAAHLAETAGAGRYLRWGDAFAAALRSHGYGWLMPGVAAAAFLDLGFSLRAGAGLFQLLCAPGILAHGVEMLGKPLTAMPFVDNDHYVIER